MSVNMVSVEQGLGNGKLVHLGRFSGVQVLVFDRIVISPSLYRFLVFQICTLQLLYYV